MKLQAKSVLIVSFSFLLLLLASFAFYHFVVLANFIAIETASTERNINRIKESIEGEKTRLMGTTIDWAQWDGMYDYMGEPDEEFYGNWMTYDSYEAFRIIEALFYDLEKKLMFGVEIDFDAESVELTKADNKFIEYTKRFPALFEFSESNLSRSLITKIDGKLYIFASAPILDSGKSKPTRGTVVTVKEIDSEFIDSVSAQTKLTLTLDIINTDNFLSIAQSDDTPINRLDDNRIEAKVPITDELGKTVGILTLKEKRPIYQQAIQTLVWFLVFWAISSVVTIIVLMSLLNLFIIKRVKSICTKLFQISENRDFALRIVAPGSDEISNMAKDLNQMLGSLETAHVQVASARDEANEANAAKSRFLAKISHELRTPLHSILGMLRIVQQGESDPVRQQYLQMARDSGTTLSNTINDLLDFSKASSGMLSVSTSELEVRSIVEETTRAISSRVYEHTDLEFICDISSDCPKTLEADPQRLVQVLLNLLGNAVKFTEKGKIELSVEKQNYQGSNWVALRISDSGAGIPEDKIPTIFEPFTQAHGSSAKGIQGTGLGLHISRQLIEAMGGILTVTSIAGVGSTFSVLLPTKDTRPSEATRSSGTVALLSSSTVLCKHLTSALLKQGYQVAEYSGLESFAEIVESRELKQIVVDATSFEEQALLAALKTTQVGKDKILFLLDPTQLHERQKLANEGFSRIVWKPVIASKLQTYFSRTDLAATEVDRSKDAVLQTGKKSLRILVADDMITNQIILTELLTEAGHTVETVLNGRELLERLAESDNPNSGKEKIDIVFSDIQMPEIDGLEALKILRTKEKSEGLTSHTPVVVVTARAMEDEKVNIMQTGADAIITKPVHISELNRVLAELC